MRIDKFEKLVSYKSMKIVRRVKYLEKEILVCEGYCRGDRDDWQPHYKTMYAISDGPEHITEGEFFTTPVLFPMPSEDDRINQALLRGQEFVDGMKAECPT